MKVIDLLNLVYENKAPKKILYKDCEYEFSSGINDYRNKDSLELFSYLFGNEVQALFLEVEIIEEKPKKIAGIERLANYKGNTVIGANMWTFYYKLNELTKAVNYLLKKSDKDE